MWHRNVTKRLINLSERSFKKRGELLSYRDETQFNFEQITHKFKDAIKSSSRFNQFPSSRSFTSTLGETPLHCLRLEEFLIFLATVAVNSGEVCNQRDERNAGFTSRNKKRRKKEKPLCKRRLFALFVGDFQSKINQTDSRDQPVLIKTESPR